MGQLNFSCAVIHLLWHWTRLKIMSHKNRRLTARFCHMWATFLSPGWEASAHFQMFGTRADSKPRAGFHHRWSWAGCKQVHGTGGWQVPRLYVLLLVKPGSVAMQLDDSDLPCFFLWQERADFGCFGVLDDLRATPSIPVPGLQHFYAVFALRDLGSATAKPFHLTLSPSPKNSGMEDAEA